VHLLLLQQPGRTEMLWHRATRCTIHPQSHVVIRCRYVLDDDFPLSPLAFESLQSQQQQQPAKNI
jgi:hypothetical protein